MKKYKSEFLVLIAAILWGTISIYVRPLTESGILPIQITVARAIFTTVILAFILLFTDKSAFRITLKDIPIYIGTGICSFLFFNFFYMSSLTENSISIACVLMYTSPIWIMIISRIFFKEKITAVKVICFFCAIAGCVVMGLSDEIKITGKGLIYGILSGFGYALYSIFGKVANKRRKPLTTTFYTFLIASIGGLFLAKPIDAVEKIGLNPVILVYFIGAGVFATVLPYLLYTMGLKNTSASKAGMISIFETVVASLTGFIVFGEELGVFGIIGILIVVASLILVEKFGSDEKREQIATK